MGTAAFDGGAVHNYLGYFSFNFMLDLHVLQGSLNVVAYRDNVINTHVVSHFDNDPLADRPVSMYDNTRSYRAALEENSGIKRRLTQLSCLPCP